MMKCVKSFKPYADLMRLNKPIGIMLLLWPTLWALWLASGGYPRLMLLFVFVLGVVLMRSAGCVINDLADRNLDAYVKRTCDRPLVSKRVSVGAAMILAGGLLLLAFGLVCLCNAATIRLALVGAVLACGYPFLKRVTHLPQVGLGLAFSWGVPMAFAAVSGEVSLAAWYVFATAMLWPVIYDTMYAMADREDDLNIGIKSTAILFGAHEKGILAVLQAVFVLMLMGMGVLFKLSFYYGVGVAVVIGLFVYQQWLIKDKKPIPCLAAFTNNHWVGFVIWIGILVSEPR